VKSSKWQAGTRRFAAAYSQNADPEWTAQKTGKCPGEMLKGIAIIKVSILVLCARLANRTFSVLPEFLTVKVQTIL
jgi:hypothetical protein